MSERRGTKALEVWCKRVTEGYPGVKVENMTTSWRDGLAFCAMIHHFRPDLIDFNSLDKRDVYRNNELAFTIAERHLGIPALLDAEDMVEYEVPDRLSMLTYLSQFYQTFVGQQGNSPNSRTPAKRSSVSPSLSSSPDLSPSMSPTSSSPPTKVQARGAGTVTVRDPCTHCGLPVFLAERLIVGNKRALYHRTCFRCARCSAQLTLANCYEIEDGRFCCETCPDEENDRSDSSSFLSDRPDTTDNRCESVSSHDDAKPALYRSSRSDDEKSIGCNADEYSASFEQALDNEHQRIIKPTSQFDGSAPLAPSQLVTDDLNSKSEDSSLKILPISLVNSSSEEHDVSKNCAQSSQKDELSLSQATKESTISITKDLPLNKNEGFSGCVEPCQNRSDVKLVRSRIDSVNSETTKVSKDQHFTASTVSGADNFTKESHFSSADHTVSSIVKMRKIMFEADSCSANLEKVSSPRKHSATLDKGNQLSKVKLKSIESEKNNDDDVKQYPTIKDCDGSGVLEEQCDQSSMTSKTEGGITNTQKEEEIDEDGKVKIVEDAVVTCPSYHASQEYQGKEGTIVSRRDSESSHQSNEDIPAHANSSNLNIKAKPTISPRKVFLSPNSSILEPKEHSVSTQSQKSDYPSELNPFGDEEEEDDSKQLCGQKRSTSDKLSTNPFGSSDEESEPVVLRRSVDKRPPRPPPPLSSVKAVLSENELKGTTASVAHASDLNPFCSDGEEPSETETSVPVPRPRTIWLTPEPSPRAIKSSSMSSKVMSSSGQFGSTSSLTSMNSSVSSNRRSKKPAPAPPSMAVHSKSESVSSSPYSSLTRSPHHRKSRPAPPPPGQSEHRQPVLADESWDKQKIHKDEVNRSKQAVEKDDSHILRDKSTYGQWKRKKGPAPPRPVPQRRQVGDMPVKELKRELDDIEVKQQELERQGVKLEQTIRLKFEETPGLLESSMTPEVEVLVLQLFELVNEKNELFRKQAELMYLRRQHRLEEEHAELEYQIRCLMEQPERNKTDSDKAKEEELIQRLVEVVERRNEIIECLDMDRLREAEEDSSIQAKLGLFAAKGIPDCPGPSPSKPKKEKKKKKEKESKKKRDLKLDADKDIDEIEAASIAAAKEKKNKRKWF